MFQVRTAARLSLASLLLFGGCGLSGNVQAADSPSIHVYFQGDEVRFSDAQPILKDDTTLVPFRKIFETLGYTVQWVESGGKQQAIGTKEDSSITLTINSTTAKVNGQNVALSVPAQMIEGSTMVPLRFVAENSGYEVQYSEKNNVATIQIGDPGEGGEDPAPGSDESPDGAVDSVEPYVVKGYVRDADGNPIAGASVYADNTLFYDSNILGVTDENGFYRLELPEMATTWRVGGSFSKTDKGKTYSFDLKPELDQPFASSTGAIRNFVWSNDEGYIFIYTDIFSIRDDLPEYNFDLSDLEITLTPTGKQIDGKEGQTIVRRGGDVYDGKGVDQIPLGSYRATARWLPEGHDPIPMLIKLEGKGKFADHVDFSFPEPKGTTKSNFMVELEVSVPPA